MDNKFYNAVRNRNLLEFSYKGHHRVVEPHAYGMTPKGNEVLRGYQTSGTSESGVVPDWRLFSINKIENLTVLNTNFSQPRFGYKPGDSAMEEIFCEF